MFYFVINFKVFAKADCCWFKVWKTRHFYWVQM